MEYNYEKLPQANQIFTFGLISLILGFLGIWCYAAFFLIFAAIAGLILSIIAVSRAGKAKKLYSVSPDKYATVDISMIKKGKTLGIIGLILSAVAIVSVVGTIMNGILNGFSHSLR